ncbi:MAG: sodium-independent anion transporter, partial [Acidobacteriota bacterium]|nr:sodium-independent anion transporter [Acidobacteriota bacterium]
RRKGTTSWETIDVQGVERVDHVLAALFDEALYFANASSFRRELRDKLASHPHTRHVIIDADAMSDLDYTGLATLVDVVTTLRRDGIDVSVARANDVVRERLAQSDATVLRELALYDSVDAAARAASRE